MEFHPVQGKSRTLEQELTEEERVCSFFLEVLGLELGILCLLDRCSTN
jgi:hypothetical protein